MDINPNIENVQKYYDGLIKTVHGIEQFNGGIDGLAMVYALQAIAAQYIAGMPEEELVEGMVAFAGKSLCEQIAIVRKQGMGAKIELKNGKTDA